MAAVKPGAEHPSILSPMGAAARYRFDPGSLLQRRITAVVRHFDVTLPLSNPQLLESFRTRNSGGAFIRAHPPKLDHHPPPPTSLVEMRLAEQHDPPSLPQGWGGIGSLGKVGGVM